MNDVKVVAPVYPEVKALAATCQALAEQSSLDRFEIAVKSRVERGIHDDNDLRLTDEMLHHVVLGGDAVEAATKPATSEAFARHKALVAVGNEWKGRWTTLAGRLKSLIIRYKDEQAALAARQQRELEQAAADARRREEEEARKAMRNGDMAGAQAAMTRAAEVVTPVVMSGTPVLENSTDRRPWEVTVTDPDALVKGIAAGFIPMSAIREFDITFLKKEAARRGGLPANWGCAARQVTALSVRR